MNERLAVQAPDAGRCASGKDQPAEFWGWGIQAAIAKGVQAVVDGKLDQKQAGLLGYYLQLALSNVGKVNFEEERDYESGDRA